MLTAYTDTDLADCDIYDGAVIKATEKHTDCPLDLQWADALEEWTELEIPLVWDPVMECWARVE
jgi:hypothetical protein